MIKNWSKSLLQSNAIPKIKLNYIKLHRQPQAGAIISPLFYRDSYEDDTN